ncbi:SdpI family protein [Domibacillus epiphyticus]|uniref:DUF1648 domain-containing protein n=1 Tax=Domibacillus epiphyticus TaxID=1714355 RepID=A0A1V2AAV6_9BACI|nr:SdpI family protein [Domibacillus epiphyticus]OMP68121.1 hypothetical protein BTO28_03990 [Domibacillus epiphyticus]
MKEYRYFWMVLTAAVIASLAALPYLPDQIATHWGPDGTVDGYSSKWLGAFFGPGMLLFICTILILAPKIDPRRQNYDKFKGSYKIIMYATVTLVGIVHALLLLNGLGYTVEMDIAVSLLIGLLFIIIGNFMPRIRPSYMIGLRTPWTIADEHIWMKTHRTGGFLFILAGVIFILTMFFPSMIRLSIFIIVILAIVLIPTVQSYLLYKKAH